MGVSVSVKRACKPCLIPFRIGSASVTRLDISQNAFTNKRTPCGQALEFDNGLHGVRALASAFGVRRVALHGATTTSPNVLSCVSHAAQYNKGLRQLLWRGDWPTSEVVTFALDEPAVALGGAMLDAAGAIVAIGWITYKV